MDIVRFSTKEQIRRQTLIEAAEALEALALSSAEVDEVKGVLRSVEFLQSFASMLKDRPVPEHKPSTLFSRSPAL
jgi:hypothetical protein